ncbi:MAG TPA: pyridoxal-dependent decarboxylase [Miltoncostaeaceae bacterium]|nr:pyridoxal-dependent decarboxylase [Miltoncostaeaceae bacterium]
MTAPGHDAALLAALEAARAWLDGLPDRPVRPEATAREMLAAFSEPLPDDGADPAAVVRDLAERAEPGLMASGSGRFHGWVIGGALPAAIAADWLVSAWDQNSAMAEPFPATTMIEQVVAGWVLELLDLPREASVGFVTGGQMANTACLAAARNRVLAAHGWDVEVGGLQGAPRVNVLVGAQRHDSVDASLRALGLGTSSAQVVPADEAGRVRPDALVAAAADARGPTIVCLQAGNVNGGAVDAVGEIANAVRREDLWLHVDGAFGLWARAAPAYRHLVAGVEGADSWATDAHKWLNTPYDCGIAVCADPAAHRRAMGVRAAYLPEGDAAGLREPIDYNPELSRRARSVPVWAALRQLGRRGVAELVERCCRMAELFAALLSEADGVEVLHQDLNQVVVRFLDPRGGDHDAHSRAVVARAQADGTCYPSGTVWRGVAGLRLSVTSWRTGPEDVRRSVGALLAAHRGR